MQSAFDFTGVSLAVFKQIIAHPDFDSNTMTTGDVCEKIVKPATKANRCSFADLFRHETNLVSPNATFFVSHVWSYLFVDVYHTLESFFGQHAEHNCEDTFFWFDVFVKNQHLHEVIDTNALQGVFKDSLKQIGHLVAIFAPWDKPTYTTRIWCLWEVLCATEMGCSFEVLLPPSQDQLFVGTMCDDFDKVMQSLPEVDVSRAQAREETDRVGILEAVQQSVGTQQVNRVVLDCIRGWVARKALRQVEERLHDTSGAEDEFIGVLLNGAGRLMHQQGKFDEALPLFQRALLVFEEALGPEHPQVATTLNNMAALFHEQGKFDQALSLYQRALEVSEKALNHCSVATTLHDMALLLQSQGKLDQALPLYQQALEVRERELGPDHPDVAAVLNNIGFLFQSQGKYQRALCLYQRALEVKAKTLEPDHPDVTTTVHNMAVLFHSQGKHDQALPLYERALEVSEKLGPDHRDTAATLHSMAVLLNAQGKYEQALPLFQRASQVFEKALGPDHPDVAATLHGMAAVLNVQGNYEQALPLYQRALRLREKALGPDHLDVATTCIGLAAVLEAQDKFDEALNLYQRAVVIFEKNLGLDHPNTGAVRCTIQSVQSKCPAVQKSRLRANHQNKKSKKCTSCAIF